ncbi:hypothetical protein VTJ83DRAFT_2410 [Remersonia thermophila]|uniref:Sphingolipid long chain base-responsive protein LSP1 n=1 Tax=Remersonia thermophila TaxID=72144 RepID=A0ABR4DIL6_9PEZI
MTTTRKSNSSDTSRHSFSAQWNRALSLRSSDRSSNRSSNTSTSMDSGTSTGASAITPTMRGGLAPGISNPNTPTAAASSSHPPPRHGHIHGHHGFALPTFRTSAQPPLSKRLQRLIKSSHALVSAHESAARERQALAAQLAEWGEQAAQGLFRADGGPKNAAAATTTTTTSSSITTNGTAASDAAVRDVTDKLAALLAEMGELDAACAARLEAGRAALKAIRDTERGARPARDGRRKVAEELARARAREPRGPRAVALEQELVRSEAEALVAEAQLGNVTRQKLREAYTIEFAATIERAEKQAILARHGLRLLQLLDDTPAAPGEPRPPYPHAAQARQILNDAEDDMREWRLEGGFLGREHHEEGGGIKEEQDKGKQKPQGGEAEEERRERQGEVAGR